MKRSWIGLWVYLVASSCTSSRMPVSDLPADLFSLHYGYVSQKRLEHLGIECNKQQFLAGMELAEKGQPFPFETKDIDALLEQFREKQRVKNLFEAESFLNYLLGNKQVIELVPGKLYCQTLKAGQGELIPSEGMAQWRYKASALVDGKEQEIFTQDEPVVVALEGTILGFAKGAQGMRLGEKRKLFIHPDLAYGSYGGLLEPNQLLIMEIELVAMGP